MASNDNTPSTPPNNQPSPPPGTVPVSPEKALEAAKAALASGDFKAAAQQCSLGLATAPGNAEQVEVATQLFAAAPDALSLVPLEPTTFYGVVALRAVFLQKAGKLPEALELLVQVMAVRPDLPYGTWLDQWLTDDVAKTIDATVAARVFDLGLQRLVQTELGMTHGKAAADHITTAVRRVQAHHKDLPALVFTLSKSLRLGRQVDEALAVVEAEHAARPTYLSAVFLAGVLRDRGEVDKAQKAFEEALAKQPDDVSVRLDLGDLSLDLGRHDDAIKQYEWVLAREPGNEWAQPSVHYARYVKTGDKPSRDALEALAANNAPGNRTSRAQTLAFAITPFLGFLPRRPESVLQAVDAVREQIRQKGMDEFKKGPIKLQLSSLEAPSAMRAAAMLFGEMGVAVDVEIKEMPTPDPRQPAQKTVYELFKYEGIATKAILPPASEQVAIAVARLAASRFHGPTWAEMARRTAKELGFDKVNEVLSTMVIMPALPRAVYPDGKPGPSPFKLPDWWFRVQLAAALIVAFIDEGWEDSVRKRALESMIFGPPDWITTVGMIALVVLANVDQTARPHAEGLLYGLIRPASSPIEVACVAQPLAHCLLQLPGLDAETRKTFRDLRADMER
jgi:tetratricopeptide (TPR) repeat protein